MADPHSHRDRRAIRFASDPATRREWTNWVHLLNGGTLFSAARGGMLPLPRNVFPMCHEVVAGERVGVRGTCETVLDSPSPRPSPPDLPESHRDAESGGEGVKGRFAPPPKNGCTRTNRRATASGGRQSPDEGGASNPRRSVAKRRDSPSQHIGGQTPPRSPRLAGLPDKRGQRRYDVSTPHDS